MSCFHIEAELCSLQLPASSTKVYKDECIYCFETAPLDLCLICYQGFCHSHRSIHYHKSTHNIYLTIDKSEKHIESPPKVTKLEKLEIKVRSEPEYTYSFEYLCHSCNKTHGGSVNDRIIESIQLHLTAKKSSEIESWQEAERQSCEHVLLIEQEPTDIGSCAKKCAHCETEKNLWLCLICGSVGCGRKQFDGTGGNGHASTHYETTGHFASVKLGTITNDGDGDVYCYLCDEARMDFYLKDHLINLGIDTKDLKKTEATISELQLQQNLAFDFKLTDENGVAYVAANRAGIYNNGNFCYAASTIQLLVPELNIDPQHFDKCKHNAAKCVGCQTLKLKMGLKGTISISAWMFKNAVGDSHPEFSGTKQQDATEFANYFMNRLDLDLIKDFKFEYEEIYECKECKKIEKRPFKSQTLYLNIASIIPDEHEQVKLGDLIIEHFEQKESPRKCCNFHMKTWERITKASEYLLISLNRIIWEGEGLVKKNSKLKFSLDESLCISDAKYLVKGFISHRGPSMHCGHYVAHLKDSNDNWILFNDDKTVIVPKDQVCTDQSYLILLQRA